MQIVSNIVLYTMMAFVLIGAAFAIRNSDSGIGKEFLQGIHSIGHLFVPVAGIMASIPYLTTAVEKGAGPIWQALGGRPFDRGNHIHRFRYGRVSTCLRYGG